MKQRKQIVTGVLVVSLLMNMSSFAYGDSQSSLAASLKAFQASVDSGAATPEAAIDTLSAQVAGEGITLDDVLVYAKGRMTDEEYGAFSTRVQASMNGLDPSQLTSEQLGQVIGQAASDMHSEGLYWSGCAQVWTGVAVIAAAVVVGIVALVKNKSVSEVQKNYDNQIKNTTSSDSQNVTNTQNNYSTRVTQTQNAYNAKVNATQNWQTAFPKQIANDNTDIADSNDSISSAESDAASAQSNLNAETTAYNNEGYYGPITTTQYNTDVQNYNNEIANDESAVSGYTSEIAGDEQDIASTQALIATYTANPGQAAIDAANLQTQGAQAVAALQAAGQQAVAQAQAQMVSDLASLQTKEAAAIAAVPASQALSLRLGVGAGVGAAVGAALLVHGIHDGVDCGGGD